MMPPFVVAAGGIAVRHWKLALFGILLIMIVMLKLTIAGEQSRYARLERRLAEATAAFARFKADVAANAALAKAQDEARARQVERDQILVTQETISAYQKE